MSNADILRLSAIYTSLTRRLSSSPMEARRSLPRKMKFTEFESEATKSGNSGHVIVPKDWIGKKVKVSLIEDD